MKPCIFLRALPDQTAPWADPWLAEHVAMVDQYDLSPQLMTARRGVILSMHQDQRWLHRQRRLLDDFVAAGGTLVVQGQVRYPFSTGLTRYRPAENLRLADYTIELRRPHPVFDGLDARTLNRRRGVAGFYARGSNPPPPNATVISTLAGGEIAVDWQWGHGDGRLFVHSGNDLWTTFAEPDANRDLAHRLVRWTASLQTAP